jgi:hypothetical protein
MLRVSQLDGIQWYCQICQTPILELTEALGLHRPLNGPMDHADVLIIHHGCRAAALTKMLLPHAVKRPLVELLAQADEAGNRG